MLSLIIKGLLLGLGAAVPIGPINVEIARRTLRAGFRAGVAIGAGAVTVDMTYAIVASLGMRPLLTFKPLAYTITIAGIALLTFLGLASIAAARRAATHDPLTDAGSVPSVRRGYITGLFMTALNPMTLAFWFVVLPAYAQTLTARPAHDLPFICFGVFLGAFGWAISFAAVLSIAGRYRKRSWLVIADLIGGSMLLVFAGAAMWKLLMQ